MHVEILVEEPSAEAALSVLVPKIVGTQITFAIHPMNGKQALLAALPGRLKGYARWLPDDWRIVVLVGLDSDDCKKLKKQLNGFAAAAGLLTPAKARAPERVRVYNRLVIEELEAWFFGDSAAMAAAYPGVSPNLGKKAKYRNPDAITGGTWEALERVLQKAGYFKAGLGKIEAARQITPEMDPNRNRSKSFQVFRNTLLTLLGIAGKQGP